VCSVIRAAICSGPTVVAVPVRVRHDRDAVHQGDRPDATGVGDGRYDHFGQGRDFEGMQGHVEGTGSGIHSIAVASAQEVGNPAALVI